MRSAVLAKMVLMCASMSGGPPGSQPAGGIGAI